MHNFGESRVLEHHDWSIMTVEKQQAEKWETLRHFKNSPEHTTQEKVLSSDICSHKVVVVDDNPMNVELLRDALDSMGQEGIPAYNGKSAIDLIRATKPDLILLDIMMPDLDGYAVLDILKEDPKTADIPVIFISALNRTRDMVRGFKHGTYDYITKPFNVEEVKARILASLRIKDLQAILQRERDKLNAIFRFSADGIALLDLDREVVSANPVFCQWFGLALSQEGKPIEPTMFYDLLGCQCPYGSVCPLHMEKVPLNASLEEARQTIQDAVKTDQDGKLRYFNIHCGQVHGDRPEDEGYVVVLRDVTEEKTVQQSKETFVATLTHDLKTPIRAEYQALDLLKAGAFGPLQEEQHEIVKEIMASNRYMSQLVDSLLTTYTYEEGKMVLAPESTDLNRLIRETIIAPIATLSHVKEQHLILNLAEELPPVWVDLIEVQRVFNNLLQNAISFTPTGGTITLTTAKKDERTVQIMIEDTGPGIAPQNLETLFERYKSSAKKFKQLGTGLGLYLSKKIVETHGGTVWVESKMGKGSRFFFTLPVPEESLQTKSPEQQSCSGKA
jgi:two-component system, LuxR family, sensor kinase FixL